MGSFDLRQRPHRRFNALTGEWVLVSPHRTQRPWQGQVESMPGDARPEYDPTCYLCPGNARAAPRDGADPPRNPAFAHTFVFDNDFAALLPTGEPAEVRFGELLVARAERGICRVVVFSPRHDLTMAEMDGPDIRAVVDTWAEQYAELRGREFIRHVQIFENKGAMMGCSNPHPHGQIWAQESVPEMVARELAAQEDYRSARGGGCLLCDYVHQEIQLGERLVCENVHFMALVPFWAVWPFETLVLSKRHAGTIEDLSGEERDALADLLRRLTTRYDNLFRVSFPYSMGMHQSPTDGGRHPECHLHLHFFPPLLRSATVRKFMVGYEMLAEPQRDLTPEASAERLRSLGEVHWRL